MKKLIAVIAMLLPVCVVAQTGVLMNRYYISGSLSLGQKDRSFADSAAWLQIGKDTTNKGVYLPRVVLDSIHTSKRALFVYDLKDSVLYHFDGAKRVRYMTYKDTTFLKQLTKQVYTTDSIPEGQNKYYTDVRARNAIAAGAGISYNNTTGVVTNSGVHSVDGISGDVVLNSTYHKQGGNSFGKTDSIGTKDNFGLSLLTNNTQRISVSNTGKTVINAPTLEDVFTVSNDRSNKIVMGVGKGGYYSDNYSFISMGGNPIADPIIASFNSGSNRLDIARVDVVLFSTPTNGTPELRGGMYSNLAGTVFGIGSRANSQGGGHIGTSGTLNWLTVPWHFGANSNIMPTSGNMDFNIMSIVPNVNQTGTANGTVRGIYINPNLMSAPDFRAVVMANNSGYGIYQSGASAKNYFNGNMGIKVTSPTEALEVGGNIKTAQPSANGAGAFKIGKVITGATVTVQTDKYLEVEIDGVVRRLAIVQ